MLDLAIECKHLEVFTHMSTCYVNCDKSGFMKEEIYPIEQDSEQVIEDLMRMPPDQQDKDLAKILGNYPNTYTFTKSMAERTLKKRKPSNLPCVILRPAIVGAAFRDPFPGWTDTLSAAGALGLAGGLGIITYVNTLPSHILDLIPVDLVVHATIVSTAF
jgi:fatty acyl-CoA reductase